MSQPSIRIDIIADVVCPWCYLGKARLEKAMALAGNHYSFSIHYQPFQLDPTMPLEGKPYREYLSQKFGAEERLWQAQNRITLEGAEIGLDFRFDQIERIPNTLAAHRLLFLSTGQPQQPLLADRLYRAYFHEGKDVGDPVFLSELARELALPEKVLKDFSQSDRGTEEIQTLEQDYREAGIQAVPTYIFNRKYLVQGGQPVEVFQQVFEQVVAAD